MVLKDGKPTGVLLMPLPSLRVTAVRPIPSQSCADPLAEPPVSKARTVASKRPGSTSTLLRRSSLLCPRKRLSRSDPPKVVRILDQVALLLFRELRHPFDLEDLAVLVADDPNNGSRPLYR